MKCFQIDLVRGRNVLCPQPARWHGLLTPPGGGSYRVFCCDDHAKLLVDCLPVTVQRMRTVPKESAKRTGGPEPRWAIRSDAPKRRLPHSGR